MKSQRRIGCVVIIASIAMTSMVGCASKKSTNKSTSQEANTSTPVASDLPPTTAATATTKDPTIREIVASKIAALDPGRNGRDYDHFFGTSDHLVAAGLSLENSVAFNTVWQGTSVDALVPTKIGDDDFDIFDVTQLGERVVVLGVVRSDSGGAAKLVSRTGQVENVDVEGQLGPGKFEYVAAADPALGLLAMWRQKQQRSLVWTANGTDWKRLEFLAIDDFSVVHLTSSGGSYLAVVTSGGESPVVKSFTFTSTGTVIDATGLHPKDLIDETLATGPGGPIFSSRTSGGDAPQLWRFRNGSWAQLRPKFRAGTQRVPYLAFTNITSTSTGWYAIGLAWNFLQVWHSSDGENWRTVGPPGQPGIREDSYVNLFNSPIGPILVLDQTWFKIGIDELTRIGSDQRVEIDLSFKTALINGRSSVAVSTRSGFGNNDRQTNIYDLESSGVGSKLVQSYPATQLAPQVGFAAPFFAMTELRAPGTDPHNLMSDDTFLVSPGGADYPWARVEESSFLQRSGDQLFEISHGLGPDFVVMLGSFRRNGREKTEIRIRKADGRTVTQTLRNLPNGTYRFNDVGGLVVFCSVQNATLHVATFGPSGLISEQSFSASDDSSECYILGQYGRSKIRADGVERKVFALTQKGDFVPTSASEWEPDDEEVPAIDVWSSPAADVDARTFKNSATGSISMEIYVNGSSVGSFDVIIPEWTDDFGLSVLDMTSTSIRFLANHDSVTSLIEAPLPTAAAIAIRGAAPRKPLGEGLATSTTIQAK